MTSPRLQRLRLFRRQASVLSLAAVIALTGLTLAAGPGQASTDVNRPGTTIPTGSGPTGPSPASDDPTHVTDAKLPASERKPLPASKRELRRDYDLPDQALAEPRPSMRTTRTTKATAAACNIADFTSRTGRALVDHIKASTTDCVNSLFALTGSDARAAFREAQMVSVANGLRDNGAGYPGNNSTSTAQLTLYLRAGYYVQWYDPATVGTYGPALRTAIQSGLDSFFANARAFEVSDANGETLSEAITLIDSSAQNARYLSVVKRMLTSYDNSYNTSWWMVNAVNNVYTVLFRGHQVPEFVSAVQRDPSVIDTLYGFASSHKDLLSGDQSYLTSNAGRELSRFLQYSALQPKVRPLVKALLAQTSLTGPTAPLWVGVAEITDYYDKANCAYYDLCNLQARLAAEVLPINHTCSSTLRIRAQEMTASQLSSSCSSLANQDAYFHGIVADSGPVANDRNTSLEVVVYNSSTDYQTYAGAMWGIDTNNGGMYLEGDPSATGNQARFIAYEAEWLRPAFAIWNLNHEYTHYLDGRFNMYGDFGANVSTPTIWWIEGFAEYVSYSYRNETYTAAITEAARRTYALSTLFGTTYSHDTTRVYRWGYLAVRYMLQSHRGDMTTVLNHYRSGNWNAAASHLRSTIGNRYDADWYSWLSACAAGNCGSDGGTSLPECSASDRRVLAKNCQRSNRGATTGNYDYLFIQVPAGTAQLKITTAGGTGNCDLYFNKSTWATTTAYNQRSTAAGNTESVTVTNPPAGYNYISLYGAAACSGVTISTRY
ncbi:M9 family metallopeptidase [Kribbella sp. CA-293567]|uniref:M9 family metallopeptidase n=1 Tax=Kribbella sp. CA-293567 TaxID=3002436 RepID=UPI0022DE7FC5|nr:M9 family metallopeptidase [Kribbella sp. CA-293567]WBQ04138.1 M9 family metallopeptidase [Kribbella sp. CA-293567]